MNTQDRRLSTRLVHYWERLRTGQEIPLIQKLNISAISDLWISCLQLRLERSHNGFNSYIYEYIGKNITALYGEDLTLRFAHSKMPGLPGTELLKTVDHAVRDIAPALEEGQFRSTRGALVKYRACALPFSDAKRAVSHVVVGLSWKEFH